LLNYIQYFTNDFLNIVEFDLYLKSNESYKNQVLFLYLYESVRFCAQ